VSFEILKQFLFNLSDLSSNNHNGCCSTLSKHAHARRCVLYSTVQYCTVQDTLYHPTVLFNKHEQELELTRNTLSFFSVVLGSVRIAHCPKEMTAIPGDEYNLALTLLISCLYQTFFFLIGKNISSYRNNNHQCS